MTINLTRDMYSEITLLGISEFISNYGDYC